jgi:hypothetical protein
VEETKKPKDNGREIWHAQPSDTIVCVKWQKRCFQFDYYIYIFPS